jgi:hypothetical protein
VILIVAVEKCLDEDGVEKQAVAGHLRPC